MSNTSLLRDALLDDGRFVLQLVVTKLYRGSNLRPDIFFKSNAKLQQKRYGDIFTYEQRVLIEKSGSPMAYNISSAAENFDVSLLALLAENACGLPSSDPLREKVVEVRKKRNAACHHSGNSLSTSAALGKELDELLELYTKILDLLEERSYSDLSHAKAEVRSRIEGKRRRGRITLWHNDDASAGAFCNSLSRASPIKTSPLSSMVYRSSPDEDSDDDDDEHNYNHSYRSATNSSSEIPQWGKVALGVTAGIAALSLAGAVVEASEQRKKRERRDEECAVM